MSQGAACVGVGVGDGGGRAVGSGEGLSVGGGVAGIVVGGAVVLSILWFEVFKYWSRETAVQ